MRGPAKFLIYALLFGGAAVFILPFAWMLSTALKPLDQTLAQPPEWLARRYEARLGGRLQEVLPGALVTEPSLWARVRGVAQPVVLAAASVRGGAWQPAAGLAVPVQVLKPIPGSATAPWREVSDLSGGAKGRGARCVGILACLIAVGEFPPGRPRHAPLPPLSGQHACPLRPQCRRHGAFQRARGIRLLPAGVAVARPAVRAPFSDNDDPVPRRDGAPLRAVPMARLDRNAEAAVGGLVLRQRLQRFSAQAIFPDYPEGPLGGRPDRRLRRVQDLLADHPAAVPAGARGGGAVHFHGHVE